ncbi:hypothetical protein CRG98_006857 [Punica granatum]|uniref:Uncharacterized protein n=1 Tax=Punica granatum TaxID=22663 RepID=A0A2I0KWD3_PUNGR|nr:hypothetical protein CRG98_006857 [Punica granatum]
MGETTFQDLHAHTGDAVACECCRSEAVLWVGLTLGTKAHLVSVGSEDRTWLSHRDGHHFSLVMWMVVYAECAWLMLPPNVLICRRRALLPGQSCFVGALSLGRGKRMCSRRMFFSFGSPGRPVESFCFGDANEIPFRRRQCEASKAPVSHARAYRDIFNDALAALSIIRRARRLRTLLVKVS